MENRGLDALKSRNLLEQVCCLSTIRKNYDMNCKVLTFFVESERTRDVNSRTEAKSMMFTQLRYKGQTMYFSLLWSKHLHSDPVHS